jgi:serine/threonine protein kinase/WD40 repeat protein
MADCPSDDDLAGFLNDSLPPDRLTGVSAHVDTCPHCQTRLDKLTHDTDGAVARYQALSSILTVGPGGGTGRASPPEAGTLILGGEAPPASRFTGLPHVPGFDVVEEIGRGGMGVVYKARHRRLNRLCALKMIIAGGAADARTVQRFLFEAEVLARVQHPQVVQVFEVDTYHGPSGVPVPYLAMELLEGGSLGRRLRQRGKFEPREAAELVEGIARAVHATHLQGIVHRDLKPGNILFANPDFVLPKADSKTETGEHKPVPAPAPAPRPSGSGVRTPNSAFLPKVTDFGLAKFTESGADLTGSGQVVGTPHYMSPEQAAGSKQLGPPTDVYALGAILFECLTGRPPFEGEEPMSVLLKVVNDRPPDVRSLRPDVARDLAAVVAKCLEKDPRRRYASSEALADDLRRFLENRPTVARPLRRRERLWLWVKRNPAVASLLAALAVVVLVAFALVTWFWQKAEATAEDERHARTFAQQSEGRATKAFDQMLEEKRTADRRQAELEFGRAVQACEEGRVAEGFRLFVRAVELAEQTGEADLARAARVHLAAWPRELPPTRGAAYRHQEQPRLAAFHPDGRHMVTVGRDGEAYLWDTTTGRKVRKYDSPSAIRPVFVGPVWDATYWSVSISPDGKTFAAGGSNGKVTVWNLDSPAPRLTFEATRPDDNAWWLEYAADGTLWVADGRTGAKRWNLAARPKPAVLQHLTPPPKSPVGTVNVLALSADGRRLYTGDRAGYVREYDVQAAAQKREWETNGWVQDVALSPDGMRLAATGPEGTARVIDLKTGRTVCDVSLSGAYGNGVAFAPKSPYLVTSDGDGNVRFWHRETGHPVGIPLRFSGEVTRMRFRPDRDEFAVPAGDAVHLCGLPDPPGDLVTAGRGVRVRGMDFSPRGDRLAVIDDYATEVFDPFRGKLLRAIPNPRTDPRALRFAPDPDRLRLFRGTYGGFEWVDPADGKKSAVGGPHIGRIQRIEFPRGGSLLLALGTGLVGRYDPATLKQIEVAKPAKDVPAGTELQVMAVRPDGGEVLVAYGNRVAFLNPETLGPVRQGWAAGDEIVDAEYTPDGKHVFIGRRDNQAELLDAATGKPVTRSMTHKQAAVAAVAVSPGGKTLLTGSRDGTARFWDAKSGLPLGPPLRHTGPVSHVLFAPNGEHVATATADGHVMLWDVPPPPLELPVEELRAKFGPSRE